MDPKRFEFRTENEITVCPAVIQWLLAEAVAHQVKHSLLAVPKREGEHAHGPAHRLLQAPGRDRLNQGLSVAMPAPAARTS